MIATIDDLPKILEQHRLWLSSGEGGQRANLSGANLASANLDRAYRACANLSGANLAGANLSYADLSGANLFCAYLSGANLSRAELACANLVGADLDGANLAGANLSDADLSGANLAGADLSRANLAGANLDGAKWDAEGIIKTASAPIQISGTPWPIMIFDHHIKIGCQTHTTEEWAAFGDEAIARMGGTHARRFWDQWKTVVLAMAEEHQSKVTEGEME